jgi:hypothetical protein
LLMCDGVDHGSDVDVFVAVERGHQ